MSFWVPYLAFKALILFFCEVVLNTTQGKYDKPLAEDFYVGLFKPVAEALRCSPVTSYNLNSSVAGYLGYVSFINVIVLL